MLLLLPGTTVVAIDQSFAASLLLALIPPIVAAVSIDHVVMVLLWLLTTVCIPWLLAGWFQCTVSDASID